MGIVRFREFDILPGEDFSHFGQVLLHITLEGVDFWQRLYRDVQALADFREIRIKGFVSADVVHQHAAVFIVKEVVLGQYMSVFIQTRLVVIIPGCREISEYETLEILISIVVEKELGDQTGPGITDERKLEEISELGVAQIAVLQILRGKKMRDARRPPSRVEIAQN